MTDKVEKIREEVEKLHGNPYYMMAVKDALAIIDSLQKEPAPKIFEDMLNAKTPAESLGISAEEHDKIIDICLYGKEPELVDVDDLPNKKEEPVSEELKEAANDYATKEAAKDIGGDWTTVDILNAFKAGAQWQKEKNESTTEDLGEYINELSKQFPEVSFAKLSRIAVRVSRWQRNQDVKNKLPKVISRTDLDEYAYQCAYDMSNDWMIDNPTWHDVEDACKLGANWQKEQMMAKAIDGDVTFDYYGDDDKTYGCIAQDSFCLEDFGLKDGDKVKVIVIKED